MPVPTLISELSTTPGSNSPAGSDAPSVIDDHLRTAYAFIRTLSDEKAAIANAVLLTGNQTIAGVKTFSSDIVGNATNVTGIVARANGGTGANYADNAALFAGIKQAASTTATGVVELATSAETQTGTDTARAITPAGFSASSIGYGQVPTTVTRTSGVTYTNTTGRPIFGNISGQTTAAVGSVSLTINGGAAFVICSVSPGTGYGTSFMIPVGATYVFTDVNIAIRTTVETR